jgi:hypothetical protein
VRPANVGNPKNTELGLADGAVAALTDFNPADIEGYKLHRRKEVSGSTVNR